MLKFAAVLALALLLPVAARAQATEAGAADILAAFTDWASSVTGEKFTPAQIGAELAIKPQDDHYVLSLPLDAGPDAPALTASITQVLGRWVIDDLSLPDQAVFKHPNGSPRLELDLEGQSGSLVLDNSFATATLGNAALSGLGLNFHRLDGRGGTSIKVGRALQTAIVRPRLDPHADLALDTAAEEFSLQVDEPNAAPVKVDFHTLRNAIAFDGTSRASSARLLQAIAAKGNPQRATAAKLPPGSVADAFAGFTSAMAIGASFDGLAWDDGDVAGSLRSGQVAFQAAQQGGFIHGGLRIEADTLALASAKLGPFASFLPRRFSLRETFSNLPTAALIHLAAVNDSGAVATADDYQRLFAPGGLQIGVEDFLLEVGGATFRATGQSVMTGPTDATATGTITATGIDTLQQRLSANRALAPGVALLIFLKGVGRTVDDRMVWDITYRDRQLTVNNQNLSAMLQSFTGQSPAPK